MHVGMGHVNMGQHLQAGKDMYLSIHQMGRRTGYADVKDARGPGMGQDQVTCPVPCPR